MKNERARAKSELPTLDRWGCRVVGMKNVKQERETITPSARSEHA